MIGRPTIAWRLAAGAFLLVACGSSAQTTTPFGATSTPPVTLPPGATATTPSTETPTPLASGVAVELEIGPGSFFLADPRVGLDGLTSYTETLTVAFEGTADGQARSWTKTYRLQHSTQTAVSVMTIEASGDAEEPDPGTVAEADGFAYQRNADGTCSRLPRDPENSAVGPREPANLLPGLMGAEETGTETANGVPASHYTFDERAMLEPGIDTQGEIWTATDGGYVVRFLRSTSAAADYFGDGLAGTMTWDYELTEVNALPAVALPAGCQIDAPIMAGASNVIVLSHYAGFDTQSSVADVIAYYEEQLPALGWTVRSEPFIGDDRAVIEFAKDDQVLNLLITPGENGQRVDLVLTGPG